MTRVEFLCGARALAHYGHQQDVVRRLSEALSTGAADLPGVVVKIQEENKALRAELRRREAALLALEAERLLAGAVPLGEARLVTGTFSPAASRTSCGGWPAH